MSRIMKVVVTFPVNMEVDIEGQDWLDCEPQFQEEYLLELADLEIGITGVPGPVVQGITMEGELPADIKKLIKDIGEANLLKISERLKDKGY